MLMKSVRKIWVIMQMINWHETRECSPHGENKKIEADDARETMNEAQNKKKRVPGPTSNAWCTMCTQIICDSSSSRRFLLPWRAEKFVTWSEFTNECKNATIRILIAKQSACYLCYMWYSDYTCTSFIMNEL